MADSSQDPREGDGPARSDSLDPSLSARQWAENLKTRTRRFEQQAPVEGSDLEARFDRWRDARSAQRPEVDPAARRHVAAVIGLVGVLAATAITAGLMVDARGAAIDEQNRQTGQLQAQIDTLPEQPQVDDSLQRRVTALMDEADEKARGLSDAQNRLTELRYAEQEADAPDDGTPSQEAEDAAAYRREVAAYIDPAEYLVDGDDAYQWTTSAPFDQVEEMDPRWPWFERYDGDELADPQSWSWEVASVTPRLGDSSAPEQITEADVVFTATDENTGEVLAFAEASYGLEHEADDSSGTFSDFAVTATVGGVEQNVPDSGVDESLGLSLRPDGSSDEQTDDDGQENR